ARPQQPVAPSAAPLAVDRPERADTGPARPSGYRPGELSGRPVVAEGPGGGGASTIGGIVDSVPGREPAHPAAPAAAPIDEHTIIEPELEGEWGGEEVDDRTVRRIEVVAADEDLEATRARPPARTPVATLAFDTGDRFAIHGAALIGRNPAPSAGEVVEHLLPIADETRSISKTHLLITASPLAAIDRASTNGSSIVRDGAETALEPGRPVPLLPGDVVRFGDRTLAIEAGEP
ncbi:FHA domain-containing protein, partial [Agrococcus sp. HG114]|nr:FHA domain-containing protein [Agrococcus sp. HG114]